MENRKAVRQGDIYFTPLEKAPDWLRLEEREPKPDGVIARGEATSHTHRVAVLEDAQVYQVGSETFLRVSERGVSIVHDEHRPVTLAPSTLYEIHRAREFDYLAGLTRRVRD
jgi:hypothetical protein